MDMKDKQYTGYLRTPKQSEEEARIFKKMIKQNQDEVKKVVDNFSKLIEKYKAYDTRKRNQSRKLL